MPEIAIAAAAAISLALGISLILWRLRQRRNTESGTQHNTSQQQPSRQNIDPGITVIAQAIEAPQRTQHRNHQEDAENSKRNYCLTVISTIVLGIYTAVTIGLFAFTVFQWGSIHRFNKRQLRMMNEQLAEMRGSSRQTDQTISVLRDQASAMKVQLDEMRATRRPWLTADIGLSQQISLTEQGNIIIQMDMIVRNTGQGAAIQVLVNPEGFPMLPAAA